MDVAIVLGTAGSGKSNLVSALAKYLDEKDVSYATVNLDPGVKEHTLPFDPDINIREFIRVEDVMDEFGLGPNGALIATMDIMVQFMEEIRDEILTLRPDILLIDTPGQMEVFTYRNTGPALIKMLFRDIPEVNLAIIFIFDPFLCEPPSSLLSLILLSESIFWRFKLPILNTLSKIDILSEEKVGRILEIAKRPSLILEYEENTTSPHLVSLLENENVLSRELIPFSSFTGEGIMDIYANLLHVWSKSG